MMLAGNIKKRTADLKLKKAFKKDFQKPISETRNSFESLFRSFSTNENSNVTIEKRAFVTGNAADIVEFTTERIHRAVTVAQTLLETEETSFGGPLKLHKEKDTSSWNVSPAAGIAYSYTTVMQWPATGRSCISSLELYAMSPVFPLDLQVSLVCGNQPNLANTVGVICLDWRTPDTILGTLINSIETVYNCLQRSAQGKTLQQTAEWKRSCKDQWSSWFTQLAVTGSKQLKTAAEIMHVDSDEFPVNIPIPIIIVLAHSECISRLVSRQTLSFAQVDAIEQVVRRIALQIGASVCSISALDADRSSEALFAHLAQLFVAPIDAAPEDVQLPLAELLVDTFANVAAAQGGDREGLSVLYGWDSLPKIAAVNADVEVSSCRLELVTESLPCAIRASSYLSNLWMQIFPGFAFDLVESAPDVLQPPDYERFLTALAKNLPVAKPIAAVSHKPKSASTAKSDKSHYKPALPHANLSGAVQVLSSLSPSSSETALQASNASSSSSLPSRPHSRTGAGSSAVTSAAAQHQVLSDFFNSLLSKKQPKSS